MVWWSGIRVVVFEKNYCEVNVRHRWINQNPFKSMFWAVQGMAAELTTGVLLMHEIQISKQKISMLVLNNKANFSKKARGRILFSCAPEDKIAKAIEQLIKTKEPQTLWLISKGCRLCLLRRFLLRAACSQQLFCLCRNSFEATSSPMRLQIKIGMHQTHHRCFLPAGPGDCIMRYENFEESMHLYYSR